MIMTKVLVAYDGSVMSKAALQEAKDLVELKPDTEVMLCQSSH